MGELLGPKPPTNATSEFIQFFPSDASLQFWRQRLDDSIAANAGLLAKSLTLVMLNNEHQIRQQFSDSRDCLKRFDEFVGEAACQHLDDAVYAKDVRGRAFAYQEYENELVSARWSVSPMQLTKEEKADRQGFASSVLFVTTLAVIGRSNLALIQKEASGDWDWMAFSKLAHWMAKQYLRHSRSTNPDLANSLRLSMARLMLNCGVRNDIYEHRHLLRAFRYFDSMIERTITKKNLIRRMDSEIIPSQQSISAILNMASCLLELRSRKKCRALVKQAERLIDRQHDSDSKLYYTAYADYVKGMSYFEDTSPLRSRLTQNSAFLSADVLKCKYAKSRKYLTLSASLLKDRFSGDPLAASALTMLGVVCVNDAADFTEEALGYFEEAIDFESKLQIRTTTATYMIQLLRVGIELEQNKPGPSRCRQLHERATNLLDASDSQSQSESGETVAEEEASSEQESTQLALPVCASSENRNWTDVFRVIAESKSFLDGYQKASLVHFKCRMKQCTTERDIPIRILCLLFISRHNLRLQYLEKVECKQDKTTRLMQNVFGVSLKETEKMDLHNLDKSLPDRSRELFFLIAFWLTNEGLLVLGKASHENQKESAAGVTKVLEQQRLQIFPRLENLVSSLLSKVANGFSGARRRWTRAHRILEQAKTILQSIHSNLQQSEKPAVAFLENYLAEAFYSLNDMIAFGDRYKNDPQLIFIIADLLKSAGALRSVGVTDEPTTEDLLFHLNSAAINLPKLSNYMRRRLTVGKDGHRVLGKFQDLEVILTVSQASDKLKLLQDAYDMCRRALLNDTEIHALIHMHTGMQLMLQGYMNALRPHYSDFNAAILKFRKAAMIFELLNGDDIRAAHCYAVLSLLYCNQVQLEDQESSCIDCLEKCVDIERGLVIKEATPSPWIWKCLEVVRDGNTYFSKSSGDQSFRSDSNKWTQIFMKFQTVVKRKQPLCSVEFAPCHPESNVLLAELLADPLFEWEEKRNRSFKAIAVMLWDREFPQDSPPSDTEIRCYSQYLTKLFNRHWNFCPVPTDDNAGEQCPLDRLTGSDKVERNHFLLGLGRYATSSSLEKSRILKQLQRNHNLLLTQCDEARRFHYKYEAAY